jgi:hypothetical protein
MLEVQATTLNHEGKPASFTYEGYAVAVTSGR